MARKSKSSKNIEENIESEQVDGIEATEADSPDDADSTESKLTEEVSETDDTASVKAVAGTEDGRETTGKAEDTEDSPPDEVETVSDDGDTAEPDEGTEADAKSEDDAPENEETANFEDETTVETEVPGVVPAQGDQAPAAPPPAPAPQPAPSAFPLVLGGLAAGAIGFLTATFAVPDGWPNTPADSPALDPEVVARIEALSGDLAALSERIENLPEATVSETVDLSPVISRLETLEGDASGLRETLSAIETSSSELAARIDEIAERPAVVSPDGSAAMEAQLETFRRDLDAVTEAARAEIEEAQARANQIEADAAAAAAEAARTAAIAQVRASLEDGSPFAAPLSDLGDVPEALSSVAADGVTPLSDLQDQFPVAARATLQETETVTADASATDRLTSFLRRHTNARSLAPREGDDVDAILSRAEAALSAGDVDAALVELKGLPEGAAGPMQGWMDIAQARADAVAAMNAMN